MLETGVGVRHEVIVQDGPGKRYFDITIEPLLDSNGTVIGLTGATADVTESRTAEETLRQSEQLFRLFIEHAPAGLAMFDREMRYIHCSRRWRTDYGLGDRELRGVSHTTCFRNFPAGGSRSIAAPSKARSYEKQATVSTAPMVPRSGCGGKSAHGTIGVAALAAS